MSLSEISLTEPPLRRTGGALALAYPPVLLVTVLVMLWSWLSSIGVIPSYFLPPPGAILDQFTGNTEVLLRHARATTTEAMAGFVIGNVLAVGAACLLSMSRPLREAFYPFALVSRAIPIIVFTPLVVVLLGRGLPPIIAIVSFSVYFPTFLNMMRGLAAPPQEHQELMTTLSASCLQRLVMVELPASVPYLFAALKVSASSAFIAALVTEWIGASVGLGYLVVVSGQYFQLPQLWAAVFTSAALTLTLLGLVHLAEALLRRFSMPNAE